MRCCLWWVHLAVVSRTPAAFHPLKPQEAQPRQGRIRPLQPSLCSFFAMSSMWCRRNRIGSFSFRALWGYFFLAMVAPHENSCFLSLSIENVGMLSSHARYRSTLFFLFRLFMKLPTALSVVFTKLLSLCR